MTEYADDDLVYVNPEQRAVLGKVEWAKSGLPKPLPVPEQADEKRRRLKKEYYPWGTYRAMKRVFRLLGKPKEQEKDRTSLDDVLPRALQEPYWD